MVGDAVGVSVGDSVGRSVGCRLGVSVGLSVGCRLGVSVGLSEGWLVGYRVLEHSIVIVVAGTTNIPLAYAREPLSGWK